MLAFRDVSYSYAPKKSREILSHITTEFDTGKLYVLYGKSGSGKTTCLKLLGGILIPLTGKIEFGGEDIKLIGRKYRKQNVSLIFQDYCLIPYMTAIENISLALGIQGRKVTEKEIAAYLVEFGIPEEECRRKVSKLSGGQQQRVAIIRSLMMETDYILADELTGNLDEENETKIICFLKKLVYEKKKGVIVASHSREMLDAADVAYRVRDGKLMEEKV